MNFNFHTFEHHRAIHMEVCIVLTWGTRIDGYHNYRGDLNFGGGGPTTSLFQSHILTLIQGWKGIKLHKALCIYLEQVSGVFFLSSASRRVNKNLTNFF